MPARRDSRRARLAALQELAGDIHDNLSLLIATRQSIPASQLKQWPAAANSVVNFGIPDITGSTTETHQLDALARLVRGRILVFEPRLHPQSLIVRCSSADAPDRIRVDVEGSFGPADLLQSFAMTAEIKLDGESISTRMVA